MGKDCNGNRLEIGTIECLELIEESIKSHAEVESTGDMNPPAVDKT